MINIKRLVWLDLIMGVCLLLGCSNIPPTPTALFTPSVEQMDKSPFTGVPCAAPCWQGLEVEKSSESEVMAVLPTLTFINQETVRKFQVSMPGADGIYGSGVLVEASCANSDRQCLSIVVIDNVLTKIVVGINYEISSANAIEYLGKPDLVGYDTIALEKIACEVYLVWKNRRLVLASTFERTTGLDQVEKNCHVVRDTGKIPVGFIIAEARYLSNAELNAKLSTGTGQFFEYTGMEQ